MMMTSTVAQFATNNALEDKEREGIRVATDQQRMQGEGDRHGTAFYDHAQSEPA